MNPCPLADWEHPVFTLDTDEAFRLLEYPKPRILEWTDGKEQRRPVGMNLNRWNYEMLGSYEPQPIGGRQ